MSESDPFADAEPVEGLEHMGKAIVDANGVPSGSPANYEATRGQSSDAVITDEDMANIMTDLQSEFGTPSSASAQSAPTEPPPPPETPDRGREGRR